jgi:hypothetical protein
MIGLKGLYAAAAMIIADVNAEYRSFSELRQPPRTPSPQDHPDGEIKLQDKSKFLSEEFLNHMNHL